MLQDNILRQILDHLIPQDWNEHPTRIHRPRQSAKEAIWRRQKKQMLSLRLVCKQWDFIVSDLVVTKLAFDTFCRGSNAPAHTLLWILASMAKTDLSPPSSGLLSHAREAVRSISASSTKQQDNNDRLWRAPFAAQIAYHGCSEAQAQLRPPTREWKRSPVGPVSASASYLPVMIFYGAEDLEEQIDKHGDVNVTDEYFGSALFAAVYTGNDQVTAKLLEKGADPNATGGIFHSALQLASSRGSTSTMQLLLGAGASVNTIGGLYGSPAAAAVIFKHKPALELLLAHGANPNLQPESTELLQAPLLAPLLCAAQSGDVEMVDRLLQVGNIDVNLVSEHAKPSTPLLVALENGHELIARHLASDSRLDEGSALVDAASCGGCNIVRFLIEERSVSLDETALLAALQANAFSGRPIDDPSNRLLLQQGADDTATYLLGKFPDFNPNSPCGFEGSAFDHAAENGLENAVRIMLQRGVSLSRNREDIYWPLVLAAGSGHEAVVKLLLENGADPTAPAGGRSPLLEAAGRGHAGLIRILLEQPGMDVNFPGQRNMTPVLEAAFNGQYEVMRVLLECGGEVNAQNDFGVTPLSISASNGCTDVVRLLLSYGARVDVETSPAAGTLCKAVARESVDIAEALMSAGADVNLSGGGGSPLYMAVRNRHEEMVRMLLQREDIELETRSSEDGRTPLELAMDEDYPEIVALLLERGACQPKRPFVGETRLAGVRARI